MVSSNFIDTRSVVLGAHDELKRTPHKSRRRVLGLQRLLREIDSFTLDHGYDIGDKWDDQINGFRLSLEIILGNRPRGLHDRCRLGHGHW